MNRRREAGGGEAAGGQEAELPLVRLRDVAKRYLHGHVEVPVLDGISLDVPEGAFEAFMGPSGSGKSTLLHLISGLDHPTRGTVVVAGTDLGTLRDAELADFRARAIGFVFQQYHLLDVLTAAENVELPLLLAPLSREQRRAHARTALEIVGLGPRARHRPTELSGGEQQRVSIARAIVADAPLLLADEPTGDLDRRSAEQVLDLLQELHRSYRKTILMVTHDARAAARADRVRVLDKGVLG